MRTGLLIARRIGIVLLFVLILLHPGFGKVSSPAEVADVQVLVVVDRTRSMGALDYDGGRPRIDGVRKDLDALAAALPSAQFGLITYGFDVQLELPFTTDVNAFTAAVDTMRVEAPTAGVGSSVDRPKDEILQALERAEKEDPDRRQMVVFVSDGEHTTDQPTESLADLNDHVDGGAVLGYGTTEGARMPAADDLSQTDGFVQDPKTGTDAISRADPKALQDLADQLGVPYHARTAPGGMEDIAKTFRATYVPGSGVDRPAKHDLTWVFGLGLFGLVLLELREGWQALWSSRHVLETRNGGRAR